MTVRDFLSIVELRTKIVSVSSCGLGFLAASADGHDFRLLPAVVLFVAALFVDMGTTAFNSYFDWLRGTDDAEHNREADKVLVHAGVRPASAIGTALVLFAVAAGLGLLLVAFSGLWLLPVGMLCMAVGFLYSGGPLPISFTPVGEPVAGGFLGSVLLSLSYLIASGGGAGPALFAALPQGLFVAGILAANNACDIEGDRAAGRRTLAVLVGPAGGAALLAFYVAAAYVASAFLVASGKLGGGPPLRPALAVAASAALAALVLFRAARGGFSHERKSAVMRAVSLAFLIHTLGLAAAIA